MRAGGGSNTTTDEHWHFIVSIDLLLSADCIDRRYYPTVLPNTFAITELLGLAASRSSVTITLLWQRNALKRFLVSTPEGARQGLFKSTAMRLFLRLYSILMERLERLGAVARVSPEPLYEDNCFSGLEVIEPHERLRFFSNNADSVAKLMRESRFALTAYDCVVGALSREDVARVDLRLRDKKEEIKHLVLLLDLDHTVILNPLLSFCEKKYPGKTPIDWVMMALNPAIFIYLHALRHANTDLKISLQFVTSRLGPVARHESNKAATLSTHYDAYKTACDNENNAARSFSSRTIAEAFRAKLRQGGRLNMALNPGLFGGHSLYTNREAQLAIATLEPESKAHYFGGLLAHLLKSASDDRLFLTTLFILIDDSAAEKKGVKLEAANSPYVDKTAGLESIGVTRGLLPGTGF